MPIKSTEEKYLHKKTHEKTTTEMGRKHKRMEETSRK
jgi:hypothetical protein